MECASLSLLCFLTLANLEDVSQYVSDIIEDANIKDKTRVHDVAFLTLGNVREDLIFQNTINKVSMRNPTMITSIDRIKRDYGFRNPSFIVIVADLSKVVSQKLNAT